MTIVPDLFPMSWFLSISTHVASLDLLLSSQVGQHRNFWSSRGNILQHFCKNISKSLFKLGWMSTPASFSINLVDQLLNWSNSLWTTWNAKKPYLNLLIFSLKLNSSVPFAGPPVKLHVQLHTRSTHYARKCLAPALYGV